MVNLRQLMLFDEEFSFNAFTHANKKNYRKYVKAWTLTCDGIFWFTVPGILSVYYFYYANKSSIAQNLWFFWLGLIFTALTETIIKAVIKRPRPKINPKDRIFIGPDIHSFPSGHSARAFYIATYSFFVNPVLGIFILLWAFGVGYSRIALGRHYPSDVIGGLITGLIIAMLINTLFSSKLLGPYVFSKLL